jgi:hypothetical protein
MTEIKSLLGDPGWWFATIVVALIVNIASSFIYDAIKIRAQKFVSRYFLWMLVIIHACMIFGSSFMLKVADPVAQQMTPFLGGVVALGIVWDCYLVNRYAFALIATFITVFGLTFYSEIKTEPSDALNYVWFFTEYFWSAFVAVFISSIWHHVLIWKHVRASRRHRA